MTCENATRTALTYALGYLTAIEGFAFAKEARESATTAKDEIYAYLEAVASANKRCANETGPANETKSVGDM